MLGGGRHHQPQRVSDKQQSVAHVVTDVDEGKTDCQSMRNTPSVKDGIRRFREALPVSLERVTSHRKALCGCWSVPRLYDITDSICDSHGQILLVQSKMSAVIGSGIISLLFDYVFA